jgi:hypothetical protein
MLNLKNIFLSRDERFQIQLIIWQLHVEVANEQQQ